MPLLLSPPPNNQQEILLYLIKRVPKFPLPRIGYHTCDRATFWIDRMPGKNISQSLAIASSAGGFKVVFVHGVLSALELAGVRADAYAATSSSVVPSISAAIWQGNENGFTYWRVAPPKLQQPRNDNNGATPHSISVSRT